MSPRRRIDGPIQDEVARLALQNRHWSPTQIHREVNGAATPELVSLRTVQRVVTDLRGRDDSGDWTMERADAEEIRLVLPVVRLLAEQRAGRPTRREAEWIARIQTAYPELRDLELVAQLSMYAARGEPLLTMVEQVLAYQPWRDDAQAFGDAAVAGHVPFRTLYAFGFELAHPSAKLRARKGDAR